MQTVYNEEQVALDLRTINDLYVKAKLFRHVKVIYKKEDLILDGMFYNHHISVLKSGDIKLAGTNGMLTDEDKAKYYKFLWEHHLHGKGLLLKYIADKRSTVHSQTGKKFKRK